LRLKRRHRTCKCTRYVHRHARDVILLSKARGRYRVSPVVCGGEKRDRRGKPPLDVRSTWREYQVSASNVIHVRCARNIDPVSVREFPGCIFEIYARASIGHFLAIEEHREDGSHRHAAHKSFLMQTSRLASGLTFSPHGETSRRSCQRDKGARGQRYHEDRHSDRRAELARYPSYLS